MAVADDRGTAEGFGSYEDASASASPLQSQRQPLGDAMIYSSGTTGRPKGIKRPQRGIEIDDPAAGMSVLRLTPGAGPSVVYLSPAPLYHGAPQSSGRYELAAYMREHLAGYKVPRRIDFLAELPRLESGKLAKYLLRREYLAETALEASR